VLVVTEMPLRKENGSIRYWFGFSDLLIEWGMNSAGWNMNGSATYCHPLAIMA